MANERKSSEVFGEGRVQLIDPNLINVNKDLQYATPDYEKMFIYVEFKGVRRGRTVIETSSAGDAIFANTIKEADTSFMGYDSNDNNTFTTSWYEDDREEGQSTSAFGIENINVKINSSYIPEIAIKFVDIRGMEFFNKTNSPYRMLFDFPPPIFELKLKGYYGKTIKYLLHLVSYDTSFSDESGNYIIEANFVSVTFAPLADIPFKYITQFSVLEGYNFESFDVTSTTEPRNTFELVHKIRNIYSQINDLANKDETFQEHELARQKYNNIGEALNMLYDIKNNELIKTGGNPTITVLRENTDEIFQEEFLNDIRDYNIRENQVEKEELLLLTYFNKKYNSTDKSLVEVEVGTGVPIELESDSGIIPKEYNAISTFATNFINELRNLELAGENFDLGIDIKIKKYKIIKNLIDNSSENVVEHYVCDITDIYKRLKRLYTTQGEVVNEVANKLKDDINDMVVQKLGMTPTIYNIFSIILNDVDKVFRILRETSEEAEDTHNSISNKNKFRGLVNEFTNDKIYSFPLIVTKGQRSSPNQLKTIFYEMPELTLVNRFIESFKYIKSMEEVLELINTTNAEGEHLWIPLSAHDSTINYTTNPYYTNNNNIGIILSQLVKRYYALSNIIIHDDFFNDEFINFYSKSEAINIANSLSTANRKNIENLRDQYVRKYNENIDNFYNYIKTKYPNIYSLPNDQTQTMSIKGFENGSISINKNDDNFVGILIDNNIPEKREINSENSDGTSGIINDYLKELKDDEGLFKKIKKFFGFDSDHNFEYNKYNLMYLDDEMHQNTKGESSKSKFFISHSTSSYSLIGNTDRLKNYADISNKSELDNIIEGGNQKLSKINSKTDGEGNSIYDIWDEALNFNNVTNNNQKLYEYLTITNNDLSLILLLSGFGNIASPYNIMPNGVNDFMSKYPMGVVIPQSVLYYMGGLVKLIKDENEDVLIDFVRDNYKGLLDNGTHLLADLSDIKKYMSENDKDELLTQYNLFKGYYSGTLINIYEEIIKEPTKISENLNEKTSFSNIILKRKSLYICSNLAFKFKKDDSLTINDFSEISDNANKKQFTDNFFEGLFTELKNLLKKKIKDQEDSDKDELELKYNSDIVDETYYSFKNINDKWIAGTNKNYSGYPFSETGNLIELFSFVDRTMRPIDDTIINTEILSDIFDDNSVSVFTALSQILSLNNFEFFPLQNFMNFERKSPDGENNNDGSEWENAFKIDTTGEIATEPAFICMYIGGGSSYPTNISDQHLFKDDGIIKFGDDDDLDFNVSSETDYTKDYLGKIKSFRVRFGEQNQSMFNGFNVDSKEYAETNESLQILSRIAGDKNQQAQIPLSQSLYNVYRNRSYSARIDGLGNATLQPTQYFQLEGVNIFNGVYVILDVEHNINKNYFTSNFGGMKVLKYPIPRVTTVSSAFGIDIGTSDDANSFNRKDREIAYTGDANKIPRKYKINNMFTFKNNTRKQISQVGKNHMLNLASSDSVSMLRGQKDYVLPFSGGVQKEWVSEAIDRYPNNRKWMESLIKLIEQYSKQFDVDPNMIAAQIEQESAYKVWVYPPPSFNSSAVGLSQFLFSTFWEYVVYNKYKEFSSNEIYKITKGKYTDRKYYEDWYTNSPSMKARLIIFQNIINNPEIMIKAQCLYMFKLGERCNRLMSTSLMSYYGGTKYIKPNFIESIQKEGAYEPYDYAYDIMKKLQDHFGYDNLVDSKNFDPHTANAAHTANETNNG